MSKETIKLRDFVNDFNDAYIIKTEDYLKTSNDKDMRELFYSVHQLEPSDSFPYTYVEEFEQHGDGQGYETFYVFQRKSDDRLFYYYIYDGRIEEDELTECTREVKTVWDFECQY